jgi:hypothetical protein
VQLLLRGVRCHRGVFLISPGNCKVLGGEAPSLQSLALSRVNSNSSGPPATAPVSHTQTAATTTTTCNTITAPFLPPPGATNGSDRTTSVEAVDLGFKAVSVNNSEEVIDLVEVPMDVEALPKSPFEEVVVIAQREGRNTCRALPTSGFSAPAIDLTPSVSDHLTFHCSKSRVATHRSSATLSFSNQMSTACDGGFQNSQMPKSCR